VKKIPFIPILVVLVIVLGYFFINFTSLYNSFSPKINYKTQAKTCDLHKGSCKISLGNGQIISLEIFPKNIPLMKTLKFKITSTKELKSLPILKIYATNMFMGEFKLKFKKIKDKIYQANIILPTCSVGGMKWNADMKASPFGARFQF